QYPLDKGPAHLTMTKGISTQAVHAGEPRRQYMDSITTPIVMTSSYIFSTMEEVIDYVPKKVDRFEYGWSRSPSTVVAIKKLRELVNAEFCEVFDNGMTSILCRLLGLLESGDQLILTDEAYKNTLLFCDKVLPRLGIRATTVKMGD